MAKKKHTEGVLTDLDWDSPPNNRFTPWPIHAEAARNCGPKIHREQQEVSERELEK
jgi:hypothetical protein